MFTIKRSKSYLIFYKFIQIFINPFLRLLYRVEIINKKNSYVMPKGGLILCCNHASSLDPIMMCAYFPRPIYFISKIELFRNKFVKFVLEFFNSFPVNREGVGRNAVGTAVEILKTGNVFGIYPEGTRSPSGEMGEVRRGVGLIAYLGNVPILPMAIYNSKKVPRENNNKKYLFLKIKIIFGDLINTEEIFSKHPKKEAIAIISELAMDNIKMLYSKF